MEGLGEGAIHFGGWLSFVRSNIFLADGCLLSESGKFFPARSDLLRCTTTIVRSFSASANNSISSMSGQT